MIDFSGDEFVDDKAEDVVVVGDGVGACTSPSGLLSLLLPLLRWCAELVKGVRCVFFGCEDHLEEDFEGDVLTGVSWNGRS
jgi:hypothetical protein